MQKEFDVAVVGSGPGGSVVSTLLAQLGYRVVMLEREKFPRFHVGESLLPSSQDIWERMGLAERLQHSGHTFKFAGEFRIARSPISDDIISTTGFFTNFPRRDLGVRPYAYHVERAVFDKQLQDCAVEHGVTLWENTAATEVLFDGDRATGLRLRRNGKEETLETDFLVDASGRRCLVARQLGAIEPDPEIRTSAVFGHFRGVTRDPGFRQGFFNGYFIEHGWLWLVPLADDVMSVGIVQNEPATLSWKGDAEEILLAAINRYQFVQERFTNAIQVGRIRRLQGLAYQTSKFSGDGWLSIGDANFFVDPLYSSGVQIAHRTGELAAEVIDEFLRGGRDMRPIRRYDKYVHKYRRTVFGPMRALYRLMRNYECIDAYVRSTGPWCNNFGNWFLRRANCWGSGYFDRYVWVIRIMEAFANAFARWAPHFFRLRGDDGWKAYERNPYRGEPLVIPKSPELLRQQVESEDGALEAPPAVGPQNGTAEDESSNHETEQIAQRSM